MEVVCDPRQQAVYSEPTVGVGEYGPNAHRVNGLTIGSVLSQSKDARRSHRLPLIVHQPAGQRAPALKLELFRLLRTARDNCRSDQLALVMPECHASRPVLMWRGGG